MTLDVHFQGEGRRNSGVTPIQRKPVANLPRPCCGTSFLLEETALIQKYFLNNEPNTASLVT